MSIHPGFAAFAYRDFRAFFCARVFNMLAVQTVEVGIGWLVYAVTDSALALGLVGLFLFVPNLALALVAGQLADMYDRKYILLSCNIVSTVAAVSLFVVSLTPHPSIPLIFVAITLLGVARAFANPASQALVAGLIPQEILANAVALSSTGYQIAIISGPALGGALYYLGGASAVFATATFFLFCALVAYALMAPRGVFARPEKLSFRYMTAGLRFIFAKRIILGSITLDLFAVLFGGATALLPIFARDIYMTGPLGLGVLRTAPAIGALMMSVTLAHFPLQRKVGRRLLLAVGVFGLATIGFGLAPSIYVAFAMLVLTGAADMMSVFVRTTLIQAETPDHMRGRVSAVNSVFIGASNELGTFESGATAALIGAVGSVVLGGTLTLLVAAASARIFPALRDRDRLIEERS